MSAKANSSEAKPAFIFFNCDDEKNERSMNIFWDNNRVVYRDLKSSRKILWEKIQDELAAGRIRIDEAEIGAAKIAVIEGDPTAASKYIKNGAIVKVHCF